jgi:hypothetical protein
MYFKIQHNAAGLPRENKKSRALAEHDFFETDV